MPCISELLVHLFGIVEYARTNNCYLENELRADTRGLRILDYLIMLGSLSFWGWLWAL